MAVQQVVQRFPPKRGGQFPPEQVGRFYVNPFANDSVFPEGFRQDDSYILVLPADKRGPIEVKRGKRFRAGISRVVCAAPDSRNQFWSERLHVLGVDKVLIDLGNVVNDIDSTFEIFNSSRKTSVEISNIGLTNADGFTFISGKVPPSPVLFIPIYSSAQYILRAEAEIGPPSIQAVFQWNPVTAGFSSVTVSFIGNRITIFTFEPQVEPVTEYEWITAITEAYDGTERRMSMRQNPRQTISYGFFKGGDDNPYTDEPQALEHVMFDSLGRTFAVPVWEDREVLTAAVGATDTVINVNTVGRDFRVGELLLLWRDWNDTEAQEIESITPTQVTVSTGFIGAFAINNTVVLPTFLGLAQDGTNQQVFKVDAARWEIIFKRINTIDYAGLLSPVLPVDFEGLPIWPRAWFIGGQSVQRSWKRNIEQAQNDVGKLIQSFRLRVPRKTHSELRVEILNRTEYEFMRQFLFALRGRQKAFWLPTFTSNFLLTSPAPAGAGLIRTRQNFYSNFVFERAPLNKIQVTLTNGTQFRHTISASADVGAPPDNETDLTITPPVDTLQSPDPGYTVANVRRIEYITKHRLNTDKYTFRALRPRDSTTLRFPIIEVINE